MTSHTQAVRSFDRELILKAVADSFRKLSPRQQFRNPVMFVVFVCSVLTTVLWAQALAGHGEAPTGFIFWVTVWLWFTLLFANFAEALAEGRGKAQADNLRKAKTETIAFGDLATRANAAIFTAVDFGRNQRRGCAFFASASPQAQTGMRSLPRRCRHEHDAGRQPAPRSENVPAVSPIPRNRWSTYHQSGSFQPPTAPEDGQSGAGDRGRHR